jgi:hypothetical protein
MSGTGPPRGKVLCIGAKASGTPIETTMSKPSHLNYALTTLWDRRRLVPQTLSGINKYFATHRWSVALVLANIAGTTAYVYAAAPSWVIPHECAAGIRTITGEPFVWFARAVPIAASFALIDTAWTIYICIMKQWQLRYLWFTTVLAWLAALWIDFAHHGC